MVDDNATLESAIRSDTGLGGYLNDSGRGMKGDRIPLKEPKNPAEDIPGYK